MQVGTPFVFAGDFVLLPHPWPVLVLAGLGFVDVGVEKVLDQVRSHLSRKVVFDVGAAVDESSSTQVKRHPALIVFGVEKRAVELGRRQGRLMLLFTLFRLEGFEVCQFHPLD